MNIYDLVDRAGDANTILELAPGPDGLADISAADWGGALVVLRGLTFRKVKLEGRGVRPNFVECHVEGSTFRRLTSHGHFWGAGNIWRNCTFDRVTMENVMSPQTRFENCRFAHLDLTQYRPCETIFSGCEFTGLRVLGMRAVDASGFSGFPEIAELGASLIFDDCTLEAPSFRNCYFNAVAFRRCRIRGPVAQACVFSGIASDDVWWPPEAEGDPFLAFLDEVLDAMRTALGEGSASHKALLAYTDDFSSGRTQSDDYSACLYDGTVPGEELDIISDVIDKIEARYPW